MIPLIYLLLLSEWLKNNEPIYYYQILYRMKIYNIKKSLLLIN